MDLDNVLKRLEVEFMDTGLLLATLTHPSCLNEPQLELRNDNESHTWLGDAFIYDH